MLKRSLVFLLIALASSGCVSEPEPGTPARNGSILDFYMPRSTESRYLYKYSGYFSGKRDSSYFIDYRGIPDPWFKSVDSLAPIHTFSIKPTDRETLTDIALYVSDSIIIEYGTNRASPDERLLVLRGKLVKGATWTAAHNYKASPDYRVSYLARVEEFFAQVEANGIVYKDVWQVTYEVTGSPNPTASTPREFYPKARRVIYFAKGIGKILEIAYSPDGREQWQVELHAVTRR